MNARNWKNKLLRERLVQKIIVPFSKEMCPEKWVFVIGCYNSGTTLLSKILEQHPQITTLPVEGVNLTDALPRPERYGWNRLWYKCLKDIRLEPGPGMGKVASRIKKQWSFHYENSPLFLEKSIANTARIAFLNTYFSPAYFIYIVRNGYAVAEGIQRKARPQKWGCRQYGEHYPIDVCAKQWVASDEMVVKDRSGIENFIPITYEALTASPTKVLNNLTDFLDIPPLDPSVLARKWRVHGLNSNIENMNEKSLSRLSPDDIEKITQVAGRTLSKYGY